MYINKKGVRVSEPETKPQAEADGGSKQGLATDVSPWVCGKQTGREGRHPHKLWTKDPWKRTVIRRVRQKESEGRNSSRQWKRHTEETKDKHKWCLVRLSEEEQRIRIITMIIIQMSMCILFLNSPTKNISDIICHVFTTSQAYLHELSWFFKSTISIWISTTFSNTCFSALTAMPSLEFNILLVLCPDSRHLHFKFFLK